MPGLLLLSSLVVARSGGTVHNNKAFRFPELFVFTTYECRFSMPLFFSQQIFYEFVSRSLISLISAGIAFLFDCRVPTEVFPRSSSHCAIGIIYNLSYDMFLPTKFVWHSKF